MKRMGLVHVKAAPLPPWQAPPKRPHGYHMAPETAPPAAPSRKAYPTDLRDAEWARLAPFIPKIQGGGAPERWPRRELVDAMLYVLRNGCAWRSLPHDFPPWSTVYYYFRKWRIAGLWPTINDALREQVRLKAGRAATPSAAILDSQSAKTTEKGGSMATTAPNG